MARFRADYGQPSPYRIREGLPTRPRLARQADGGQNSVLGEHRFDRGDVVVREGLPTIRELIVTSAFIDADHKLISDQKARDSQYAVSCSSIAGVSRRS
jgi:hypothetical protein